MVLRVGPAVRRRLGAIQQQLEAARKAAGTEQHVLAVSVGVSDRTLRGWERCYDIPSMPNLIRWARLLGFRLALMDRRGAVMLPPVSLPSGESLVEHELRRFAGALKARREDREISQTDLSLIVGVSRSSLQRWEDGLQDPIVLSLMAWADRLGCTVDLVPDRDAA